MGNDVEKLKNVHQIPSFLNRIQSYYSTFFFKFNSLMNFLFFNLINELIFMI